MKHYFNIELEPQKDQSTGMIGFTNKHSFKLKTTMFGQAIDTVYISLGKMVTQIDASDTLHDITAYAPQEITEGFNTVVSIKMDVDLSKVSTGKFYTLGDYDNQRLSQLDNSILVQMDSNIKE